MGAERGSPTDETQAGNPIEEEMRAKRAIKFAEKEHQENLDRARDLTDVSKELLAAFKKKNGLDREDNKKLDRLEKLSKRIRSDAGGSEDEVRIEKPPADLSSAMCQLGEVSESLRNKVEKTPRQVVSASVIAEANVLLELIRIVRSFSH